MGVGAQHPGAGRVERHHPHRAGGAADEQLDPLAHLLRGLVGEGDRQDLVGARLPGAEQVRDPVGEHAGLARAGAGQDQQRPLSVRDRVALRFVEALEQGVDRRCPACLRLTVAGAPEVLCAACQSRSSPATPTATSRSRSYARRRSTVGSRSRISPSARSSSTAPARATTWRRRRPASRRRGGVDQAEQRSRTVLSSLVREGRWTLAPRNRFSTVLGTVRLDLREAVLPGPEVEIDARAFLGTVEIIVPEGVHVEVTGGGLLSSQQLRLARPAARRARRWSDPRRRRAGDAEGALQAAAGRRSAAACRAATPRDRWPPDEIRARVRAWPRAPGTCASWRTRSARMRRRCRPSRRRRPTSRGASPEERAAFSVTLNAINFGSGWFPTLRKAPGCRASARSRRACARTGRGPPPRSPRSRREEIAGAVGQDPEHELMGHFAATSRARRAGPRRGRRLVPRARPQR